jgi:hypothetical protein
MLFLIFEIGRLQATSWFLEVVVCFFLKYNYDILLPCGLILPISMMVLLNILLSQSHSTEHIYTEIAYSLPPLLNIAGE